jgi:hypothetical protein
MIRKLKMQTTPFWEKSLKLTVKIHYTEKNLWNWQWKSTTQKKVFEIDRENPLHRKKSLKLTVKIHYTEKNLWNWPWKSATQKKIFEIDSENPLQRKKSLKLTVKIHYTEKNLWNFTMTIWDFWENDPLSKSWRRHWTGTLSMRLENDTCHWLELTFVAGLGYRSK